MNEENRLIVEQLNKFGKVPTTHELLKMIKKLEEENEELKSQLKGTTHCYDVEEHERLKKQLEELPKEIDMWNKIYNDEFNKNKKQQQEFIKYLEDEIELGVFPKCAYNTILQKYKEIVGSDNNGQ